MSVAADFKGKTVVITGASSGIGRATALEFAKAGANVALLARRKDKLEEAQKACEALGAKALALECDVTSEADVRKAAEVVGKRFGAADVLVNNAGYGVYGPFAEMDTADIEGMMKTNYFGLVHMTKAFLPGMRARGSGAIVNVASMAGKLSFPNLAGYCASKFAVAGFTEALYFELKPEGIQVHLLCPAGTKTEFFDHASFEGHAHRVHYDRMMEPGTVAKAILRAVRENLYETCLPAADTAIGRFKGLMPGVFRKLQEGRQKQRRKAGAEAGRKP